ncbi:MAG: U32 family peptidase [Bacteroidales bacterium]|nr:U32 family peptidase [Bacteroidales bacterium]
MSNIEIMSPVGNFETLSAAIQGGADSVYFGVEQLNMRAKSANNFKISDLNEIVDICKTNNVKTYLALNTIIYDHDLKVMRMLIDEAKKADITAIIASDIAVMSYAFKQKIEIHASTQLNISNIEALRFYSKYFDVVVLARELSLMQVRAIYDAIQEEQIKGPSGKLVELEIFAHGALCMAVSGKCYLSLHEKNSSANRGACQQTCRHAYTVTNKETGYELEVDNEYIMSPKDLSTIDFLDKIIESGVTVLKLEGRARPAEYVRTVTEVYKQAIIDVENGNYNKETIKEYNNRLERIFNRGFWDGYYLGRKLGEWSEVYGSKATRKKQFIGIVTNYYSKIGVAEIQLKADTLNIDDEILIIGTTTGAVEDKIKEIRKELNPIDTAKKGDTISIAVPELVRRNDKLYKLEKTIFDKNK